MDYAGEQQMELEALEAIFMDELEVYTGSVPSGWTPAGNIHIINIFPQEEGEEIEATSNEELQMEFLFAHSERYPEEPPFIKVQSVYGLTDGEIARCLSTLEQQVQENLGMAMIYTLITAAKEWLRNRAMQTAEEDPELAAKKATEMEEAKRAAARAHGTPVTVEQFLQWKAAFDAEMLAAKAQADSGKDEEKRQRQSGKAYFMQHKLEEVNSELAAEDDEDFTIDDESENIIPQEDDDDDEDFEDDEEDIDWEEEDDDEDEEALLEALAAKA